MTNQIEVLTAQVRQLPKRIYRSRSEKSKYQGPDERQNSLCDDEPSFNESEQIEEQGTESVAYTVTRLNKKKKRNTIIQQTFNVKVAKISCMQSPPRMLVKKQHLFRKVGILLWCSFFHYFY